MTTAGPAANWSAGGIAWLVVIRSQALEVPADATGVGSTAGVVGAAGVAADPPHPTRSSAAATRPATMAGLAGMRIGETSDSGGDPRQTWTVQHRFPAAVPPNRRGKDRRRMQTYVVCPSLEGLTNASAAA